MNKSGYEKVLRPHNRSLYQAYVSVVVKPIYDVIKQIFVILGLKTKSTLLTFMENQLEVYLKLSRRNYVIV